MLLGLPLDHADSSVTRHVVKCVAALINKMPEGESLDKWLKVLDRRLLDQVTCSVIHEESKAHLLVWMCKAVVMRGHATQHQYVQQVFNQMPYHNITNMTYKFRFGAEVRSDFNHCMRN